MTLVPKPGAGASVKDASEALVRQVAAAATVRFGSKPARGSRSSLPEPVRARRKERSRVVAIGASLGGPVALRTVLQGLSADPGAPILVTQHISPGFVSDFVAWLDSEAPQRVVVATRGPCAPGTVYVAPADGHLVLREGRRLVIDRTTGPVHGHSAAVDVMFTSVAEVAAEAAVGVLLTGMGRDGARGLLSIQESGGTTLVQDEASCTVYGMPRAAIELKAVEEGHSPEVLASRITAALQG
ncbi:CheB methylesterase domain-containing protein [Planctomycetota bacterium]|nr:CheB methylesterase domain-containing protein [Planctomycetota bacterium]